MKEDAAVAIANTLEAQGQLKILEFLVRFKVAVGICESFAVQHAVLLDGPAFGANRSPSGKVLTVKELNPIFAGNLLSGWLRVYLDKESRGQ